MSGGLTRLMRVAALALLFALAGAFGGTAQAADAPALANLRIMVWPEYDDPRVLVIYQGEFADKTGFPREVAFFVPSGAEVLATAYYADKAENPLNTDPWKLEDAGNGFSLVSFSLPANRFHMEFYYNPLPAAPDKAFDYVYRAAQATAKVRLEIQQPLKAEKFSTDPASTTTASGNHGFKNHVFDFPALAPEQTLRVKVQYTKTDPNPSVTSLSSSLPANTNPATADSQPAAANDPLTLLPYVIAAAALALAALAFFAWRGRQQPVPQLARARPRRKGRPVAAASVYCTQCGNALDTDDNFCSVCGTARPD